jgi:hypothetical protein
MAAVIAALYKKSNPNSLEVAAEKRKNLGFLKVMLVSDPRKGLSVLHDSIVSNSSMTPKSELRTLPTYRLASDATWVERSLIATRDYLYVLSVHKKDEFPELTDLESLTYPMETPPNSPLTSSLPKTSTCMYGFVEKIRMENIVSIEAITLNHRVNKRRSSVDLVDSLSKVPAAIAPAPSWRYKASEVETLVKIALSEDIDQHLQPAGSEQRESFLNVPMNKAYLNASFRIVARDIISTSMPLEYSENSAIPQPVMPDMVIYFSTGFSVTGEAEYDHDVKDFGDDFKSAFAVKARDEWVDCIKKASDAARYRAGWRLRREAVQGVLRSIYFSVPFQVVIVIAICTNFAVSVAQVQVGEDAQACLATAMNVTTPPMSNQAEPLPFFFRRSHTRSIPAFLPCSSSFLDIYIVYSRSPHQRPAPFCSLLPTHPSNIILPASF